MGEAFAQADMSEDPSTQVGCVLVDMQNKVRISAGWNGLPRKIRPLYERLTLRPDKYKWMEHAERNAIYNAARTGICTHGSVMYLNVGPGPCTDCARSLIQAGITELYTPLQDNFPGKGAHWEEDLGVALEMLSEAGILVRRLNYALPQKPKSATPQAQAAHDDHNHAQGGCSLGSKEGREEWQRVYGGDAKKSRGGV